MLLNFKKENILVPKNYKGNPNDGTDIALIGIEKSDYQNLISYIDFFDKLKDMNNKQKDPFFEDADIN